jgi:hypothetical protein
MITFNDISVYNILNLKFIFRIVLFSMYYVIFRWATGDIKFWESAISRGVGRRTQPISKLLNDLLITSALDPTWLVQSALNPTCLYITGQWFFYSFVSGPEQKYPWLYDSVVHQVSNFCELLCGHSSSSQECVTVGVNLGLSTVWSLYMTGSGYDSLQRTNSFTSFINVINLIALGQ